MSIFIFLETVFQLETQKIRSTKNFLFVCIVHVSI